MEPNNNQLKIKLLGSIVIIAVAFVAGYFLLRNKAEYSVEQIEQTASSPEVVLRKELPGLTVRDYKVSEEFIFPIFESSDPADTEIVEKINTALQNEEIGATFENPIWKEESGFEEGDGSEYEMQVFPRNLIQLGISSFGCRAYCDGRTSYYLIDRQLGRLVGVKDIFTEAGLKKIGEEFYNYKLKTIEDYIVKLEEEKKKGYDKESTELITDQLDGYKLCVSTMGGPYYLKNKEFFLENFSITSSEFVIEERGCFPHATQAIDDLGGFYFTKTFQELEPYLNDYGKSLFFE